MFWILPLLSFGCQEKHWPLCQWHPVVCIQTLKNNWVFDLTPKRDQFGFFTLQIFNFILITRYHTWIKGKRLPGMWVSSMIFVNAVFLPFLYPRFEEEGLYCFCYVCPSILPSLTNILRRTFLSNHASHPLQTWYGVSARGPTSSLQNSRPPVAYFCFTV